VIPLAKGKGDLKKDTTLLKKGKIVEGEFVEKDSSKKKKASTTNKKKENSVKKNTTTKTTKSKGKKSQVETKAKQVKKQKSEKEQKKIVVQEVKEETQKEIPEVFLEKKSIGEKAASHPKAYFFPRVLAYLIDIMIVTVLSTLLISVVPENKNYVAYLTEYQKIQSSFMGGNIDSDEYVNKTVDIVYDIDYNNVIPMIIEVSVLILYFIVFQFYNKGQTLGKKLLRIRVISEDDGEVSMNQYILRSFIIPSVISKMLIIALVLFVGRRYYYYADFTVQGIQTVLMIVSIFMVMYSQSGRGLHDRVAKTKVIMTD